MSQQEPNRSSRLQWVPQAEGSEVRPSHSCLDDEADSTEAYRRLFLIGLAVLIVVLLLLSSAD